MSTVDQSLGLSWTAGSSRHEITPRPSGAGAQEVGDVELRLAEELVAAARLERDERAEQDSDGRRGEAADRPQLVAPALGVEERQERAEVGQVEERQALLVGVVEDEREALLLRRVGAEHLREQERAEVGDGRPHRDAGADAAEREVLDREAGRRELEAELAGALLRRAVVGAGHGHAGHVALDVRREHRDTGRRQLLGDDLHRARLAGSRRARDEAVAVHRREREAHTCLGYERAGEHRRCPSSTGAPFVA